MGTVERERTDRARSRLGTMTTTQLRRACAPGMPCEVAREFASQMMADIEEHRGGGEATHVHAGTPDDFFDFDSQFADEDDDADFDGFDCPCCFDGEDDMVSACMDLLTAMTMFARGQSLMLEALQHRPEVMELMQGDD